MNSDHLWSEHDGASLLIAPGPGSHKYSRGVLGLRTGSAAYPGAAVLGAESAWHTGIGSVRFISQLDDGDPPFGLPTPAAAVLASRPETVFSSDTAADRNKCDAWVIGSGTDSAARSFAETTALTEILGADSPVVVDAGALDMLTSASVKAPVILTPHFGEFQYLLTASGLDSIDGSDHDARVTAARALAGRLGATVLLKGSRTLAAAPSGEWYEYGPATPWLATAGTGDVLAGALATLAATHSARSTVDHHRLAQLGVTAAMLHDRAARAASAAAGVPQGGPITALAVARALSGAVAELLP
ncbi:ADP-dependent NAD(P)H-hydrate dehydratase [Leucobacter denitrificans]|uniref:ADP-dependent (S)-NAD(P)H-hydrate dehydratase n=1 Tax=Leucobacter denitrificans TaxID=683042 RepID=A0A7G9S4N7_9MICO|nr:ADP/ATP-dependent (S)-NAD(P)H-hydrate dehydratase [Leucobacter denitrificans]QNN62812.1 NAD(P)H-hydrate dehydratase [Leucobacter denitrificans]